MNIDNYLSTHLKDGERLVRVVRQHPAVLLPGVFGGGGLILLDFFLLAWWFRHHGWGVIGFTLVLVVAGTWLARSLYLWRRNLLLITTNRVIDLDQRGFFERRVVETTFDKIQDIRYAMRGLWSTFFHFGTISLYTAGATEPLDLSYVVRPAELHQQLSDLQQQRRGTGSGPLSADELVAMVGQLKSSLGPEQLDQLLRRSPPNHGSTRQP